MSRRIALIASSIVAAQAPHWKSPDLTEEDEEIQRTATVLRIDIADLRAAAQRGRLVALDDRTWSRLANTDSWRGVPAGGINVVRELAQQYGRDVERLVPAFQSGWTLPAPIVLMLGDRPYLISGNTRLMVAKALRVRPQVWLVSYRPA